MEVDAAHEQVSLVFLFPDEALFLPAKILVPGAEGEVAFGALGGRIPRFASEAILDFLLYRRLSHTTIMMRSSRVAHW